MKRRLVWFSCGAASAVAAKLAVDKYGDGCEVAEGKTEWSDPCSVCNGTGGIK